MRQTLLMSFVVAVFLLAADRSQCGEPKSPLDKLSATRTADVIYGRKFGTALTLDVFTPKKDANGAAIVLVVSGGWVSDNKTINSALFAIFLGELLNRGYTVFAVVHGSQPRYTIPEAIADINRAVRY